MLAALTVVLTGCSLGIPTDPDGTLDRVRDGILRVGVSLNAPWTATSPDAELSGSEIDLVRQFADELNAEVEWSVGGEEALVTDLEHGGLDLVVGGLTAETPWADKAAITAPYDTSTDARGQKHDHVMAVPMGENAFLVELESFLLGGE